MMAEVCSQVSCVMLLTITLANRLYNRQSNAQKQTLGCLLRPAL